MQPTSSPESNVVSMLSFAHQRLVAEGSVGFIPVQQTERLQSVANSYPLGMLGDPVYRADGTHITIQEYPQKIEAVIGLSGNTSHSLAHHIYTRQQVEQFGDGDLDEGAVNLAAEYRKARFCDIVMKRVVTPDVTRPRLFLV